MMGNGARVELWPEEFPSAARRAEGQAYPFLQVDVGHGIVVEQLVAGHGHNGGPWRLVLSLHVLHSLQCNRGRSGACFLSISH